MSDLAGPLVSCQEDCNFCHLVATTQNVINFGTDLAVILGTGAIIIGGIMMMISGGSESKYGQAVKTIKTALQGILILFAIGVGLNTLFYEILGQNEDSSWTEINCDGVRQIITSSGSSRREVSGDTGENRQSIEGRQTTDAGGGLNTTEGEEVTDVGQREQVTAFPTYGENQDEGGEETIVMMTTLPIIESISEWIGEERPVVLRAAGEGVVEFRITRQNGEVVTDWQTGREGNGQQTLELPLQTGAYEWQARYQQNPEIVSEVGSFNIDREPPDGTVTANINQQTGVINVQGNFSDQGGSDLGNNFIAAVEKKENEEEWQAMEARTASFSDNQIEPGAAYKYRYTITDGAGNMKNIESNTVSYDVLSSRLETINSIGNVPFRSFIKVIATGTAEGTVNYTFYCDGQSSNYNYKFDGIQETEKIFPCDYEGVRTYRPKVLVERGSLQSWNEVEIVARPPQYEVGITSHLGFQGYGGLIEGVVRPSQADRAIYSQLMKELNVDVVRDPIMAWGQIQQQVEGQYNLGIYDDIVRKISDQNIDILAVMTFMPCWATSNNEQCSVWLSDTSCQSLSGSNSCLTHDGSGNDPRFKIVIRNKEEEFRSFVRIFVNRYKNLIKYYELLNETDFGWYVEPNEYAYWLKIFYEEVKSIDPNAKVLHAGLTSPGVSPQLFYTNFNNQNYFSDLLSAPSLQGDYYPYFDIVNFHNYPLAYGEPTDLTALRQSYQYLKNTLQQHNLNLNIWLTEIGYPDNIDANGLQRQADLAKMYIEESLRLGIEKVFYFSLWDHGEGGKFGVVTEVGSCENISTCQRPEKKPVFFQIER